MSGHNKRYEIGLPLVVRSISSIRYMAFRIKNMVLDKKNLKDAIKNYLGWVGMRIQWTF